MKSPRQSFCEQKEIADAAAEAIASTPVQRAMVAAYAQVSWGMGQEDHLAHAKLAGARAFMEALNVVGVPPAPVTRRRFGSLDASDEPGVLTRKGANDE